MLTDVSVDITKLDPRNSRCIDMRAKLFPTSMGRIWTLDELRVSSMPDSPLPETMGIFHQPAVGLILKDIHQCGLWDSDSEDGDNPDDTAIPHSYCCNTVSLKHTKVIEGAIQTKKPLYIWCSVFLTAYSVPICACFETFGEAT